MTKVITTGWTGHRLVEGDLKSDVLTIWGMETCANAKGDTYALSMSFDATGVASDKLQSGSLGILTQNANAIWIDAAAGGRRGQRKFVVGPYHADAGYRLGTWGVDPATHTAWVVLDHGGQFAVAEVP